MTLAKMNLQRLDGNLQAQKMILPEPRSDLQARKINPQKLEIHLPRRQIVLPELKIHLQSSRKRLPTRRPTGNGGHRE